MLKNIEVIKRKRSCTVFYTQVKSLKTDWINKIQSLKKPNQISASKD